MITEWIKDEFEGTITLDSDGDECWTNEGLGVQVKASSPLHESLEKFNTICSQEVKIHQTIANGLLKAAKSRRTA